MHQMTVSNSMRQKLIELQGEINESTITTEDFNNPVSELDRSGRQKTSKDTVELNNTKNQLDIIDIYRLLHPKQQSTHFLQAPMKHSPRQTTF